MVPELDEVVLLELEEVVLEAKLLSLPPEEDAPPLPGCDAAMWTGAKYVGLAADMGCAISPLGALV